MTPEPGSPTPYTELTRQLELLFVESFKNGRQTARIMRAMAFSSGRRAELSRLNPEMAKLIEGQTNEELRELVGLYPFAYAVAQTVLAALHTSPETHTAASRQPGRRAKRQPKIR